MKLKKLVGIFSLLFIFNSGYSQSDKVLSLDNCIKLGLEQNKTLEISKSKVESANAKSGEVDAAMLPPLKMTGSYTRPSEVINKAGGFTIPFIADNYMLKISLQQPVFTGFRLKSNSEIMEYNFSSAKEDYRKDEAQLILDIKNAYWSHFNANQLVKTINETIGQVEVHLKDIENFYEQNLATDNDVLKVKVQLSNLKLLKIDAENAVSTTRMVLNNLIGLPTMINSKIQKSVDEEPDESQTLESVITMAYESRPELKGMEYRIKSGESGVSMANAGWYPQVNFAANYNYAKPNARMFFSRGEFKGTWDVGINFSFDIWNWMTTSHQVEQAKASLEQTRYSAELIRDAVNLEVSQSYLSLIKSKEKISYAIENRDQAKENYRVTNEKFKAGMVLNSELIDAESSLLIANINYTSAIVEYKMAWAKLEKATGK